MTDTTPNTPAISLTPTAQTFITNAKAAGVSDEAIAATLARNGIGLAPPASTVPTVPVAPAVALDPATLDPEIVRARENWIGRGLDPAAFDAAVSPKPATGTPHFDANAEALANRLLAAGMAPEKVDEAMAKAGYVSVEVPDDRSEEEIAYDLSSLGAPVDPNDYKISFVNRTLGLDAAALAQLNSDARAALSAMRLPADLGASLVEMGLDDSARAGGMSTPQRSLWQRQQVYDLGQVVGQENVAKVVSSARILVSLIGEKDPALAARLHDRGIFQSARVVANLARQFERMEQRAAMVGRRGGTGR